MPSIWRIFTHNFVNLSQVTKVLQKSEEESKHRPRHYFPMGSEEGEEEEEQDDDDDEKMMDDHDMMSIMNEEDEDDMEEHGLHLSLFGEIVDEKVDHVEVGNLSAPDRYYLKNLHQWIDNETLKRVTGCLIQFS